VAVDAAEVHHRVALRLGNWGLCGALYSSAAEKV